MKFSPGSFLFVFCSLCHIDYLELNVEIVVE